MKMELIQPFINSADAVLGAGPAMHALPSVASAWKKRPIAAKASRP